MTLKCDIFIHETLCLIQILVIYKHVSIEMEIIAVFID